jgi:transcriptional regulator with XRE-family HTH domain
MFARQLNVLCARSERKITNIILAQELADRGCGVSTAYLSQLRNGVRAYPGAKIVEGLADYFEVPVDYFFEAALIAESRVHTAADIEILEQIEDAMLRRLLACAQNLSVVSLNLLIDFACRLRIVENLLAADPHTFNYRSKKSTI